MGLAPLEIHPDPDHRLNHALLVFEAHNASTQFCLTVVAVVELERDHELAAERRLGGAEAEDVREWTAYWAAHPTEHDSEPQQKDRIEYTRRHGNKIPRSVAEAMFPRFTDAYFRE
jgi:hypothetical protein